ncbi:MAG TPA: glycosyltransferase [Acidimicrobiales bacterium]|nr:glycosyltransferase [Acidimicrobiales bacterium]
MPIREHPEHSVREISVPPRPLSTLETLIGPERYAELRAAADRAGRGLGGRTIWNVSSTAAGGGVAEMLQVLVGYSLDAGIDIRWLVMSGDPDFFKITKRIHNRLHGIAGDDGELGIRESAHYADVTAANALSVAGYARPGDVVLLHDPQTVGMVAPLAGARARVIWRCHVGRETSNEWTDQAWSFLRDHLAACEAFVFSVPEYVPPWMEESRVWVIPPSIDPFSPKNQEIARNDVERVLRRLGLLDATEDGTLGAFTRLDGTAGFVERGASILSAGASPLVPDVPLVTQVSRWDRLKDMAGVMSGFASVVAGRVDAQLLLVGPSVDEVADDPEGADVFAECVSAWRSLPAYVRASISLVTLPMDDIDENAAMVNAIQRHSTVIVQKSLAEGFGLTVAEGMWKAKAVVASSVGGIPQQIAPGTGVLLEDPTDLVAFGGTLASLLSSPSEIAELGAGARRHVLDGFVGDKHLMRYADLIGWLVSL